MQNDKIYSDIVSLFARTKLEANLLFNEVDVLSRSLFVIGDGDFESTLKRDVRAKVALALEEATKTGNKEEALTSIKNKINALEYVDLTIAFEPTQETIERIYTWVNLNVGSGVSLNINVDKSIIGGAVIEYKGRIFKSIISQKIDDYFLMPAKSAEGASTIK